METIYEQMTLLLINPPGNMIYHLVLVFAITAAMQFITTLVAFIGVLSSLLALQLEKAREQLSKSIRDYLTCSGLPISPLTASLIMQMREKWCDGDYSGVIVDGSSLIESDGLPSLGLAVILALRAAARSRLNDTIGSQGDLNEAVARIAISSDDRQFLLATLLVGLFMDFGVEVRSSMSDLLARAIESSPAGARGELTGRACFYLAGPDKHASWPAVVRRMCQTLSPETAKSIGALLPVADVLEGRDRGVLDALPPEERAFALNLLARFEPKREKPKSES